MFYNIHPKQTEISVFHCQQCAQKALKGFLISHDALYPSMPEKACGLT
jgi:HEPN domain-containing protein